MIMIVNVTKKHNFHKLIHDYELRINNSVITTFRHKKSKPLEAILKTAAQAVSDKEVHDIARGLVALSNSKHDGTHSEKKYILSEF